MNLIRIGRHVVEMNQVVYIEDGYAKQGESREESEAVTIHFVDKRMLHCFEEDAKAARALIQRDFSDRYKP